VCQHFTVEVIGKSTVMAVAFTSGEYLVKMLTLQKTERE